MLHRRTFLLSGTCLAGAALLWSPRASWAQTESFMLGTYAKPPADLGGEPLEDPIEISSKDGILKTTLTVDFAEYNVGETHVRLRSYNDLRVSPTIRVKPSDSVTVGIKNALPAHTDVCGPHPDDHNFPNHENSTNLHVHGWHVSPVSDDIFRQIRPLEEKCQGDEPVYTYQLENHTPGTFWYHPHRHGSTALQVANGMAGALIVDGPFDESLRKRGIRERILVFNQLVFDEKGKCKDFGVFWDNRNKARTTINGQVKPVIPMRGGEVQRWRIINAGFRDALGLRLDGIKFHQFAVDGITFDGRMRHVDGIFLGPGNRVDVFVQAPMDPPGTELRLRPVKYDPELEYDLDDSKPVPPPVGDDYLATIRIEEGPAVDMALPDDKEIPAPTDLPDITDEEIDNPGKPNHVIFGVKENLAAVKDDEPDYRNFNFMIKNDPDEPWDAKKHRFDPDRVDHHVKKNTAEEWLLNGDGLHPFHIHVNPFQVTEINGKKLKWPMWKDVAVTPPRGVRMRTRYTRYTGKTVLHCHILYHEDLGMMQVVEIED